MILEWFTPKEFYKRPVSVERKSWTFPYFYKTYCQKKNRDIFVGHPVYKGLVECLPAHQLEKSFSLPYSLRLFRESFLCFIVTNFMLKMFRFSIAFGSWVINFNSLTSFFWFFVLLFLLLLFVFQEWFMVFFISSSIRYFLSQAISLTLFRIYITIYYKNKKAKQLVLYDLRNGLEKWK